MIIRDDNNITCINTNGLIYLIPNNCTPGQGCYQKFLPTSYFTPAQKNYFIGT